MPPSRIAPWLTDSMPVTQMMKPYLPEQVPSTLGMRSFFFFWKKGKEVEFFFPFPLAQTSTMLPFLSSFILSVCLSSHQFTSEISFCWSTSRMRGPKKRGCSSSSFSRVKE